jgi:hypothetical protein
MEKAESVLQILPMWVVPIQPSDFDYIKMKTTKAGFYKT